MQHRLRLICIKTRRNWNTGATAGSEDMPGKSLFSRSAPVCISSSCLAWNFKTYMKRYPHRKSRQGFCSRQPSDRGRLPGNTIGNTETAGLAFGVSGRYSKAKFFVQERGGKEGKWIRKKKKRIGSKENRLKKWIPHSRRDPFFQRI